MASVFQSKNFDRTGTCEVVALRAVVSIPSAKDMPNDWKFDDSAIALTDK